MQNGTVAVYVQQRAVAIHHVAVALVVAQPPVKPGFEVPFTLLREVLTHKQQLFAGVTNHHRVRRFKAAELVEFISHELIYHTALAVHHFVVRQHEHIIFVEDILERVRHKPVMVRSVNGVFIVVFNGIVHPAHIPFQAETETAVFGGFGYACYYGAVFRDKECGSALAQLAVKMFEELEAFKIFVAAVLVGAVLLSAEAVVQHCRNRVHAQRVNVVFFNPEESGRHKEI